MTTSQTETNWEAIWVKLERGDRFDKGVSPPVLAILPFYPGLPDGDNLKALVPGCGRGYDVHLLASHPRFAKVTGVDIAPTAIERAQEYLSHQKIEPDCYALEEGDFLDSSVAAGPFDVAFDSAFLCSVPPARRVQWASAYASRLRVGAVLATLMFPVAKPASMGGPPYGVEVEEYESLLTDVGFECVEGPHVVPDHMASADRGDGKTVWAIWKRMG